MLTTRPPATIEEPTLQVDAPQLSPIQYENNVHVLYSHQSSPISPFYEEDSRPVSSFRFHGIQILVRPSMSTESIDEIFIRLLHAHSLDDSSWRASDSSRQAHDALAYSIPAEKESTSVS
jgi:hypothetical protein